MPKAQTQQSLKIRVIRWLTVATNEALVAVFVFARLWTPKHDIAHLYNGLQAVPLMPAILLLPALNLAALYILLRPSIYAKRKFRVVVLLQSIVYAASFVALNILLTNQATNTPLPSAGAMWGILGLPVLLIVTSAMGVGRKASATKLEAKILPPRSSHKPSDKFGPNPLTGLGKAIWALKLNWRAAAFGWVATLILTALTILLNPKAGTTHALQVSSHAWIVLLVTFGVSFLINWYQLVVSVATGKHQNISPKAAANRALKLLPKLFLLETLMWLFVWVGFVLLIVPGVILAFRFALARVILVGENTGPITALKYSSRLMKRNGMQVIGVWFLLALAAALSVTLEVLFKPWGGLYGSPLLLPVISGLSVFLTWLYHDLDETKRAGFSRLRVHWLNILSLFGWMLLGIAAIIGFYVVATLISNPPTSLTTTPCYEVTVPTRLQVTHIATCHIRAEDKYVTLEYIPLVDSADSVDMLVDHQLHSRFSPSRYHPLPGGVGINNIPVDSQTARTYSFIDQKTGANVTASFVHTTDTFRVNGVQVRNFILVATPKTDAASTDWGPGMFTDSTIDITTTIQWPPYGSTEFKSQMQQVYADWTANQYQKVVEDASTAASLADSDQSKAAAFSYVGDAEYRLGNLPAATAAYEESNSLDSTNIDALDGLGNAAFASGDTATAIRDAKQIIGQDDTDADAYNLLAVTYDYLGNIKLAETNIEQALKLDPENPLYQHNATVILNPKLKTDKNSVQLPQPSA